MDKFEKLNNLKLNAMSLIKSFALYMKSLQPLNNPEFMNPNEKKAYDSYKVLINEIAEEYETLYRSLSVEERSKHEYMNMIGEFNSASRKIESIELVYGSEDEYELKEKFGKAYKYGLKAIEDKYEAMNRKDIVTERNCNRVLAACSMTFKGHYWGESYQSDLDKYEARIKSGRTVSDDLVDLDTLFNEAIDLSIEYANALINDEPKEEIDRIWHCYEPLFAREEELVKFVPREQLRNNEEHNIHWLRLQVQSNPRLFIARYGVNPRTK